MKKIIALLLLFTIGISSFSMPVFAENRASDFMLGDANHSFEISINDATDIQKYLAGLSDKIYLPERTGCVCTVCADVNEDGTIDIKDVTEIQKYLVEIETGTRCGTTMENYNNTSYILTGEEELKVKNAYIDSIPSYNIDEYGEIMPVFYYGTLSDGSKLVRTRCEYMGLLPISIYSIINNYVQIFSGENRVDIFINNEYHTIREASEKRIISDELLDEIAEKLHFFLINTNSKLK